MTARASPRDLARLRMLSQQLVDPEAGAAPLGVVRAMLAMQAQDYAGALWAIGVRSPDSTVGDVTAALASGSLVRSWPMRGTLHITAAEDLGWLLELTAPRLLSSTASRRRELGITDHTVARARDILVPALAGLLAPTRGELFALLDREGISPDGQRVIHVLAMLCQQRVLCLGPMREKQQTFVRFDEWLPAAPPRDRDDALGELAERYFGSHGPATVRDLARWSNVTVADARRGVDIAGSSLEALECDGGTYLRSADARSDTRTADRSTSEFSAESRAVGRTTFALPGFDELLLGYGDRSAVLEPRFSDRVVPGNNGVFQPTIVDGGIVVGTWRRKRGARGTVVTVEPFAPLRPATLRRFGRALESYARFLGEPVRMAL